MPAQFYPECAQVTITGGGSLAPTAAELVSFPGAYSNNDPGLNIDIYSNAAQTQTTYVIPGPPLYGSTGSTGSSGGGGSTGSGTTTGPTQTTTTTSSAPTASCAASGAAQYAQCGGQGWTGATACVCPHTCTVSNRELLNFLRFFFLIRFYQSTTPNVCKYELWRTKVCFQLCRKCNYSLLLDIYMNFPFNFPKVNFE